MFVKLPVQSEFHESVISQFFQCCIEKYEYPFFLVLDSFNDIFLIDGFVPWAPLCGNTHLSVGFFRRNLFGAG